MNVDKLRERLDRLDWAGRDKLKAIKKAREEAFEEAKREYNTSTYEAFTEYRKAIEPHAEKWEKFQAPHFERMRDKEEKAEAQFHKALLKLLSDEEEEECSPGNGT